MIELLLDGNALPLSFLVNVPYRLTVQVDGGTALLVKWVVYQGSTAVASGTGDVLFGPVAATTHTINVIALHSNGTTVEDNFTVTVTASPTVPAVGIDWGRLAYAVGDTVEASIRYRDPEARGFLDLSWSLKRNNAEIVSGTSTTVRLSSALMGVYRLVASVTAADGSLIEADSTVRVSGGTEIQASVRPRPASGTLQLLGTLYSKQFGVNGGLSPSLPYVLGSFTDRVFLLPGTTHVRFSLASGSVDDELVVRTPAGNWPIVGPPLGLESEDPGYNYTLGRPPVPAPDDGVLDMTFDVVNVHGATSGGARGVVAVECLRLADQLYSYARCGTSQLPGGEGGRLRRMMVVFTGMDIQLDVYRGNQPNRLGSDAVESFTSAAAITKPAALTIDGTPDVGRLSRGFFFTQANKVATYEPVSADVPDLDAYAVYGIPGWRPFIMTLNQAGDTPVVQRIKRLSGSLLLYMAGGALDAGASVDVRIETSGAPFSQTYTVPVAASVYAPDNDIYYQVGSVAIDLSDFQFSNGGLVAHLEISE